MNIRPLWIILGIVAVIFLWAISSYNGLLTSRGLVTNRWAQVETQYQRRFELVPNLVSTVKGAANFEQSTLTSITEARSAWTKAGSDRTGQIAAAGSFEQALSKLIVSVEAYPTLTATQGFRDLQVQLEGTENRIAVARKDYNDAVFAYNLHVQRFPGNIIAKLFSFTSEQPFEAVAGSEKAPTVDFSK